ncbi:MAG: hypothetical protein WC365_05660 [Candidatus Babeliales bacterium]
MTGKSLWQQLKDVADCDKKIAELASEIARIHEGITKDLQFNTQQETLIHTKERAWMNAQKELNNKELALKELKTTEDKKRTQLDNVKNQKEYKALEGEIETLSRKRALLEEDALKDLYDVDALKKEFETLRSSTAEKATVVAHDQHIKQDNLNHLEIKQAEALKTREEALQHIPEEWRIQYERMRLTVQDPIVPVINDCCGSCFYSILHQDLSKLKKSQVVVCRSCYRFLYYEAAVAQDGGKAEY